MPAMSGTPARLKLWHGEGTAHVSCKLRVGLLIISVILAVLLVSAGDVKGEVSSFVDSRACATDTWQVFRQLLHSNRRLDPPAPELAAVAWTLIWEQCGGGQLVSCSSESIFGKIGCTQGLENTCIHGIVAALYIAAASSEGGNRAALLQTAFFLGADLCFELQNEAGWRITYEMVVEELLAAEQHESGLHREDDAFTEWLLPAAPVTQPRLHVRPPVASQDANHESFPTTSVRVLLLSNHASYMAEIMGAWQRFIPSVSWDFYPESLDLHRCPQIQAQAGSSPELGCPINTTVDPFFLELAEHMHSTHIQTCSGLWTRGIANIAEWAKQISSHPTASGVDLAVCLNPPYLCRLFVPHVLRGGALLGYFGAALDMAVPGAAAKEWLADFVELSQQPSVRFFCITPYLAARIRFQTGVAPVVAQALGSYITASYFPTLPGTQILIWKTSSGLDCCDNSGSFDNALRHLAEASVKRAGRGDENGGSYVSIRFQHLAELRANGGASFAAIAKFLAVVLFPYDPPIIAFYELYSMNIPLLIPSKLHALRYAYRGAVNFPRCDLLAPGHEVPALDYAPSPFNLGSLTARRHWSNYLDWYNFPGIAFFSSLAHLVDLVRTSDFQMMSGQVRRHNQLSAVQVAGVWTEALGTVFGRG